MLKFRLMELRPAHRYDSGRYQGLMVDEESKKNDPGAPLVTIQSGGGQEKIMAMFYSPPSQNVGSLPDRSRGGCSCLPREEMAAGSKRLE